MKLFGRKEAQSVEEQQTQALLRESNALSVALANSLRALNIANDELAFRKMTAESEFNAYMKVLNGRRESLKSEVSTLEERKAEAMKPVDELMERAKKSLRDTETKIIELDRRESTLVEREELIFKKEKQVEASLALALETSRQADEAKASAMQEAEDIKFTEDELKKQASEVLTKAEAKSHKIDVREQEVAKREQDLDLRTASLAEEMKALAKEHEAITDERKKLKLALALSKKYGERAQGSK